MHNWYYTLQKGHSIIHGNFFFAKNTMQVMVYAFKSKSCTCKLPSVGVHTGANSRRQMNHSSLESCNAYWKLTHPSSDAWTYLAAVWYRKAWSPNASHSSAWLYHAFLQWRNATVTYNTVSLYILTLQNKIIVSTWNACALLYKHAHLMVTFTSTCHILSNVYTLFHALYFFCWGGGGGGGV
jgi:hypothetical protein